mgnify:CR=1 FL=1
MPGRDATARSARCRRAVPSPGRTARAHDKRGTAFDTLRRHVGLLRRPDCNVRTAPVARAGRRSGPGTGSAAGWIGSDRRRSSDVRWLTVMSADARCPMSYVRCSMSDAGSPAVGASGATGKRCARSRLAGQACRHCAGQPGDRRERPRNRGTGLASSCSTFRGTGPDRLQRRHRARSGRGRTAVGRVARPGSIPRPPCPRSPHRPTVRACRDGHRVGVSVSCGRPRPDAASQGPASRSGPVAERACDSATPGDHAAARAGAASRPPGRAVAGHAAGRGSRREPIA